MPYLQREAAEFVVGVDSGQTGIFDAAHYRDSFVKANLFLETGYSLANGFSSPGGILR